MLDSMDKDFKAHHQLNTGLKCDGTKLEILSDMVVHFCTLRVWIGGLA